MGDGINPTTAYDENGNILRMTQKGLLLNTSSNIDSLQYSYASNSNKLMSVTDLVSTNNNLGDFTDNNTTGDDYAYDSTGSLTADKNKGHTITYNQFNLPWKITIPNKGEITYIYDAAGRKLEKRTHILKDSTRNNVEITATTAYISGYIYQDNKLSFFGHEEGRIRVLTTANSQLTWAYDYFLKDHLGNIRTVLTDEQKQDNYPAATMELGHAAIETALYSNVATTRSDLPTGYPVDTTYTNPNIKVAKVSAAQGEHKIGPSIVLKVMAGDHFNVKVSSWYRTNGATPQSPVNPLTDLVLALANGISGAATTAHGAITPTNLQSSGVLSPNITSFLDSQEVNVNKPKAYLNWILLDEHLKLVSSSSGAEQVGDNDVLTQHLKTDLPIDKNGYLYVYVSNETPNIPVFFDNLQVTHTRGPLLEEDHYYPFGLQMKALCSKAANALENRFKFNGGTELDGDFGMDIYETFFRGYDAQIGRFRSVDPKAEYTFELSTFQFSGNNPIVFNDPLGDLFTYKDHNGNQWHAPDPLAGTGAGGSFYQDGYGLDGFGETWSGGGGGGFEDKNSNTETGTVSIKNGDYKFTKNLAQNVFKSFLNAFNHPNSKGEWSFKVESQEFSVYDKENILMGTITSIDYGVSEPVPGLNGISQVGVTIVLVFSYSTTYTGSKDHIWNWQQIVLDNKNGSRGEKANVPFYDPYNNKTKGKRPQYYYKEPSLSFGDSPSKQENINNVVWKAEINFMDMNGNIPYTSFTYGWTLTNGTVIPIPIQQITNPNLYLPHW